MFVPPHMVMLCSPCGDMIVHLHLILYHCLSWCKRSSVMNIGSYQVFFRPWFQKVTKLFCPHVHKKFGTSFLRKMSVLTNINLLQMMVYPWGNLSLDNCPWFVLRKLSYNKGQLSLGQLKADENCVPPNKIIIQVLRAICHCKNNNNNNNIPSLSSLLISIISTGNGPETCLRGF